jgi:citrate synthase
VKSGPYLSASEAAQELGISLATLYSYVSRGLLRSEFADRSKRTRRYHTEDVQRLKDRQEMRRDPQKVVNNVVDTALHWGTPMRDSALTLIDGGKCYYRGQDATVLAGRCTVEQTAALLWTGDPQQADALFARSLGALPPSCRSVLASLNGAAIMERLQCLLPLLASDDLAAYDLRAPQVAQTGARILRQMARLAIYPNDVPDDVGLAAALQQAWKPDMPVAAALFSAALILCADHELNVSSFTARCIASAGSPPYAAVSGGLAALQGAKHGGNCARVEALFRETGTPAQARIMIAQRLRRGETVPGFGHPLYPAGDPRGRLLLELVTAACPNAPGVQISAVLAASATAALSEQPNVDFGLATLCAALSLPPGTALALFALGRAIGWIAHAIEEYQTDRMIRPRAHYTGPMPTNAE